MSNQTYLKDQVFLAGVALVVLGLMALFFLLLSWVAGGDAFLASIYGKETMGVLVVAIGLGAALMAKFGSVVSAGGPLVGNKPSIQT